MSICMYTSLEHQYWLDKCKTNVTATAEQVEAERQFLKKVFDDVDANGDGKLTKQELVHGMHNQEKDEITAVLGNNFFYMYFQVDEDKDGKIGFDEFVNWAQMVKRKADEAKQQKFVHQFLQHLFLNLDIHHTLQLTIGELITEMKNGNVAEIEKALGKDFLPYVDQIDHDGDAKVNFVEFCDWVDLVSRKQEAAIKAKAFIDDNGVDAGAATDEKAADA